MPRCGKPLRPTVSCAVHNVGHHMAGLIDLENSASAFLLIQAVHGVPPIKLSGPLQSVAHAAETAEVRRIVGLIPRSRIVRRIHFATGFLCACAVLSTHLSDTAGAQEPPQSVLPPADETEALHDYTKTSVPQADQTTPNANSLPQLQDTPPRTRPPGTSASGSSSPDFLRGLQLADTGARRGRQSHQSLLAPAQFHGNFFGTCGSVAVNDLDVARLSGDIPAAGGNARFSIADNNKPLPQSRVFFDYRHFNNAIGTDTTIPGMAPLVRRQNFDGFLFGIEKTLDEDELTSVEIRLPFSGNADFNQPGYGVSGGEFGNIPISWKQAVVLEDSYSMVVGSTLITPTGGDVTGQLFGTPFSVNNEAWHLAPFIGGMLTPQLASAGGDFDSMLPGVTNLLSRTTFQCFGSVDFALNEQGVVVPGALPGGFRESTLMFLSSAVVLNLFDEATAKNLTRVDGSVELHYSKNIGGGSSFATPQQGAQSLLFSQNRISDLLNLTAGVSAEIRRNTRIQVAAAAPLSSANSFSHRAFDGELIVSINRFF